MPQKKASHKLAFFLAGDDAGPGYLFLGEGAATPR